MLNGCRAHDHESSAAALARNNQRIGAVTMLPPRQGSLARRVAAAAAVGLRLALSGKGSADHCGARFRTILAAEVLARLDHALAAAMPTLVEMPFVES
jgi:hypothetical protein